MEHWNDAITNSQWNIYCKNVIMYWVLKSCNHSQKRLYVFLHFRFYVQWCPYDPALISKCIYETIAPMVTGQINVFSHATNFLGSFWSDSHADVRVERFCLVHCLSICMPFWINFCSVYIPYDVFLAYELLHFDSSLFNENFYRSRWIYWSGKSGITIMSKGNKHPNAYWDNVGLY